MGILILKMGETFEALQRRHGDFEDWIRAGMGGTSETVTVHDARHGPPPVVDRNTAVILTGSPDMVTDQAPWMRDAASWLVEVAAREVPVLGICFGHQLLAHAGGGTVDWLPRGREIGTVEVTITPEGRRDPLLGLLPASFAAHSSHAQTVVTLPMGATLLATSPREPHHAFRMGRCAWGVQFHPEFDEPVMRAYIDRHREELIRDGDDPGELLAAVRPSPASDLLAQFVRLALSSTGGG